jgi:hypothetical protein
MSENGELKRKILFERPDYSEYIAVEALPSRNVGFRTETYMTQNDVDNGSTQRLLHLLARLQEAISEEEPVSDEDEDYADEDTVL